tara:strand:- start:73 stop:7197 length:7125 start_codon:yes stop_codon:yes gene_type:complete
MSRINRDIYTSLDINGPYIRIDTQPTDTTLNHNGDAVFTLAASTYYMTGDEAEIGDIDTLETDAVAPTDPNLDNLTPGVPHTAKNDGYISYQWYEIDANSTPIGNVTKLTDSIVYSGTTTPTLTVKNVQSPGTHLNQYYCVLDYIPNLTSGQYDTGNAVNDTVTSDIVTLNVRPFLIIDTQPSTTNTLLNPNSGTTSTTASLSDTRTPWEDYKLEFQWWERNKLNEGEVPNTRLLDGVYSKTLSTILSEETVVDQIQRTTYIENVSSGNVRRVGIPTEAVSVEFSISGGRGGSGGNESSTDLGGVGGKGIVGNFKFSDSEISSINNASGPIDYIIGSGSVGNNGGAGASANGGLGGLSYDLNVAENSYARDSVFGGKGGNSGPGGISGAGGGGGGASGVIRVDSNEWMVVAAGGGGGGGASKGASGEDGGDAGTWEEWNRTLRNTVDDIKLATVVNYNPVAGTPQGANKQDPIDYGFYIKTSTPISSVNTTTTYRVVVIWDGQTIINGSTKFKNDDIGYYLTSGNDNYYISLHRGSELGWCNNDSLDSICIRGDGGYTNTFDIFRDGDGSYDQIDPHDGGIGVSKIIGDGGGGGGGGGGGITPAIGGTAGADPIPADFVDLTFKVTKNATDSQIGLNYIKFIEKKWYGFPETAPGRGQVITVNRSFGTQTVRLKTNTTYDVISSFEPGDRTSDGLRILQDFTPNQNQNTSDVIAGRSIGMDLDGDLSANIQTGNEDSFLDFIVSVSDGTFDVSPETVRTQDGEILGKAIIRFTTPAEVKNSTKATGGEGGNSVYNTNKLEKISGDSLNNGEGSVSMTIVTEQPFDVLDTDVTDVSIARNYQISGAHPYTPYKDSGYTSDLTITSDYVFSKRILCQITVKDTSVVPAINAVTSGSNTLYTNVVDFNVSDNRDNTITVEQIRHNDDFAVTRALNLINGDLTFEKSTDTSIKETEYYSFYSNNDIEVDVKMYGGKGSDVGGNSGGEGGFSYLRLNMKRDTEYVIAGLNDYVNTPFLFKKGQLLAVVGGGGDAGYNGNGAPGGGVSVNGGNAYAGGVGGVSPTTLGENGVHGSATNLLPVAPDTKASIPNGGTTIRCSKGNLFQFANQPNPCADRGTSVKFATSDGTLVTNTKEINRGFKAGYNIFNTAGRANGAVADIGWGGCGATGGQGSDTHGGGGGSGYISPDFPNDILVRSEGNASVIESAKDVESERDTGLEGDGIDSISSTLGGSTGPARVVISLAEVPTVELSEFIERPATPNLSISNEDVVREPSFTPLPEIVSPPPINPPEPRMSTTSTVSKGFVGGNQTKTSFNESERIGVLETGSLDINVQTTDIPGNTTFYWKLIRITTNSTYSDADFDAVTGSFTTNPSGAKTVNISPAADNVTDFIGGNHDFRVRFYTDPAYKYQINTDFKGRFRILDNSLAAPSAVFSGLNVDKTSGTIKANNEINEGDSVTYNVATLNIPNGDTLKWYIEHIDNSAQDADFNVTSGTITVNSGFTKDADGVATPTVGATLSSANQGTTSFTIDALEDQVTEGTQVFAFKIEYPVGSGTFITNTRTGVGDFKKSVKIIDTSKDRAANITANGNVNEGDTLTVSLDTENMRTNETIHWAIYESDGVTLASTDDFDAVVGSVVNTEDATSSSTGRTGSASFNIEPKSDETTEGPETFIVKLWENSARNRALKIIGSTTTQSQHSFIVNDTSLDTPVYRVTLKGLGIGNVASENSETQITFLFEGWNLTSESDGPKIYHRVLKDDGSAAISGSFETGDFGDEQKEYDFDKVTGFFTPTRAGYTKTSGSTVGGIKSNPDVSTGHIVPYHTNVESSTKFKPVKDYLDDQEGDKFYEIHFYNKQTDWEDAINEILVSDEFKVKNDSLPIYHFDQDYGLASTGGYNKSTSWTGTPQVDENQVVSFRIETTAAPGKTIYYSIAGISNSDLEEVDTIPSSTVPQFSGPDECFQSYANRKGDITTVPADSLSDRISGVEKTRSIAWIYLKTVADLSTEGDETATIRLYKDSSLITANKVAEQSFIIKDTSVDVPKPTISLNFNGTAGLTDLTVTPENNTTVSLYWNITGAPTGGTYNGFSNSFITGATPSGPPGTGLAWYQASTYDEFTVFGLDPKDGGGLAQTITFSMTVTNSSGSASASATLNINHPTTPDPVVEVKKIYAPKIWRYKRIGANGNQRFAHTIWGPGHPDVPATYRNTSESQKDFWGEKFTTDKLNKDWDGNFKYRLQGSVGGAFEEKPPVGSNIQNVRNYKSGTDLDGWSTVGTLGDLYAWWTDSDLKVDTGGATGIARAWYLKDIGTSITHYALGNASSDAPGYPNDSTEFVGVDKKIWGRYQGDGGWFNLPTGNSTYVFTNTDGAGWVYLKIESGDTT